MGTKEKTPKSERESRKKEKKHKHKHKREDDRDDDDTNALMKGDHDEQYQVVDDVMSPHGHEEGKDDLIVHDDHEKSSLKKKKKKRHHKKDDDNSVEESTAEKPTSSKSKRKRSIDEEGDTVDADKSNKRTARRLERKRLLEELPKVDPETGFAYTKQQLRRMRKRVARGLDPIETPREKHERMQRRAQEDREEEDEWAGVVIVSKPKPEMDEEDDDDAEDDDDDDHHRMIDADDQMDDKKSSSSNKNVQDESNSTTKQEEDGPPKKKLPRTGKKPVPSDYVCQACQNKHQPAHFIYDCPDKVTVRGTNKKKKKGSNNQGGGNGSSNSNSNSTKGIHDPDARKVFLSGLPFDTKHSDIVKLFDSNDCGKVVHCKMIKFPDTQRCKGQAYVTLETEEYASKACSQLTGMALHNQPPSKDSKKGKHSTTSQRKEPLKLKVVKALNRLATKKQQ